MLYPIVAATPAPATVEELGKVAAASPPADMGSVARIPFGQRRTNAAVTMLRLGEREKVLPVFGWTIVFPPGESTIGSPEDEPERWKDDVREKRHPVKLTRPFALLDREITMEELIAFKPMYVGFMQQVKTRTNDGGFGADWYDSFAFCRWLGEQMGLPESDQAYGSPESLDKE